MSGISVLHSVLEKLEELSIAADKEGYFTVWSKDFQGIQSSQADRIIHKLKNDGIIEYSIERGSYPGPYGAVVEKYAGAPSYYRMKILETFYEYHSKIKIEILKEEKKSERDIAYAISYNYIDTEIKCNGFVLSKPQDDSINQQFFQYVYNNPNKKIIIKDIQLERDKDPHKILDELGFNGQLKKAFFAVNQKTILFRNPLYKKDLEDAGLYPLRFRK